VKTYLFYDLETTGLNPAFDQAVQFAAIRTDSALNELERYDLPIRLRPDVVPAPQAVLIHRINPLAISEGRCEYDAVRLIHALFNRPQTISVGYNSLGFDDEFLRFAFFRNLLTPYTHQHHHDCGRMDMLTFAAVYRLFKPAVLHWPECEGRPTLRLEELAIANRLAAPPFHAAMNDVAALLGLARRLHAESETWNYLCGRFDKGLDQDQIRQQNPVAFSSPAGPHRLALMVSNEFGASNGNLAPVLGLGPSDPYPNQRLWLRLDHPDLAAATEADVDRTTRVVRKKYGEPPLVLPPWPRYWEKLDAPRREMAEANLRRLKNQPELTAQIVSFHRAYRYPEVPDVDPDAALYDHGFWHANDLLGFDAFHQAAPLERPARATAITDPLARTLAIRLLFRNFTGPHAPPIERARTEHLKRINPAAGIPAPVDYRGRPRLTAAVAREEIGALLARADLAEADRRLLGDLDRFIAERFGAPPTGSGSG
jgi:exodeoxyribonuclease-1